MGVSVKLVVLLAGISVVLGQDVCESVPNDCTITSRQPCSKPCGRGEMLETLECTGATTQTRTRDCCLQPCPPGGGNFVPVKLCRDCWPKCDLAKFETEAKAILADIDQLVKDFQKLDEAEQTIAKYFLKNRIDEYQDAIVDLRAKMDDMAKSEADISLESREQLTGLQTRANQMEDVLEMIEDDVDALVDPIVP